MKSTIAEFILRQASDAAELAQRAKVLAALTQLPPQRRNELAQAVDMVCRTIASHGGKGKVRFSLVTQAGQRTIEVSVSELGNEAADTADSTAASSKDCDTEPWQATVIQRVGELVDHFESSGWPVAGSVIRMAQTLPPAFSLPSEAEFADWEQMLQSNTALDALTYALRRARSLEKDLGDVKCQHDLHDQLKKKSSESDHLAMLSLVISKTKNAISILRPDGRITGVNEAFVQMTGYLPSEAHGRPLSDLLFGPSSAPPAVEAYHHALTQGEELMHDILRYRKDGGTYWVESNVIPVRNGDGDLTQWIVIDTDITRRQETETALREAKETAEKNSRLKSEFLANMSHEIRTPMNAIIGMTELTLSTKLTDQQQTYLQTVRSSSEALLNLLNDILDLSKIEAGKMDMEETNFALPDVVQETISTLDIRAREKGLILTSELSDDLPRTVRGDPTKLRQVLMNLVGNAIKFTEKGKVTVSVESHFQSSGEIALHFAVRDTGIGIPSEKLDEIFQAFQQGDTSTTRQFGGTGLGLTISSELVRLMHGRIWVDSTVSEGSTFHFTVLVRQGAPLALPPAADESPHESPPESVQDHRRDDWKSAPRVRPLTVLVADDHTANRQLVTSVLDSRGHRCVEATTGQEAVDAWQQEPFDALLMDVQMPVMDGFQATAIIRQQEEGTGRHLPIIALTAHAMAGDREQCLAAGMDAYLPKPLRPHVLVELVESVADLKPAASPTASPTTSPTGTPAQEQPVHQQPEMQDQEAHEQESDEQKSDEQAFSLDYALESLDNETDLLVGQMKFFLQDTPVLLETISQAIDSGDAYALQVAAHRLKGMLARYAFHDAASLAQQLETLGRSEQLTDAPALLDQLRPLVSRLAAEIHNYVSHHERR